MDRDGYQEGAAVRGDREPGRVTRNEQEVMEAQCLFDAHGEAREVINVGGPLGRVDDRVVALAPQDR
eukprot:4287412-Lingulodinium_polyedra.AAC.1